MVEDGGRRVLHGQPLNWFLLPRTETGAAQTSPAGPVASISWNRNMVLLSGAFALANLVAGAIAAGALIGRAQVAVRLVEAGILNRFHPIFSAWLAAMTHPLGAAVLGMFGGGAAAGAFAVLHGSGNGILTIARGTVPLAILGAANYGYRPGLLGAPARIAQAGAPLIFGLAIEHWGARSLMLSSVCGLAALAAFCMVRSGAIPETVTAGHGDQ